MGASRNNPRSEGHAPHFAPTRWSLIAQAGRSAPHSREALESLCRTYWYPVYAHVRRAGFDAESAADLTQGFFAYILGRDDLATLDRSRGRFRSWLLASVNHFLSNERDRRGAQKRVGDSRWISLWPGGDEAERSYRVEPFHELTPEKAYEHRWAMALLGQVMARLGGEAARAGRTRLFELLKSSLAGDAEPGMYRRAAVELGMTESAVYVAAHRMRHRCRALLYEAILDTVGSPDEVEDEVRRLFAAVGQ